jgi:hypothetical protein
MVDQVIAVPIEVVSPGSEETDYGSKFTEYE